MRTASLKKFVSFFMMVIMLFTGICLHDIERFNDSRADSSLACIENVQDGIPALSSTSDILSNLEMCTEEQLGIREVTRSMEECSRIFEGEGERTGVISLSEILPRQFILSFIMRFAGANRENLSSTVIIGYVHNQDGAKS